MLAVAAVLPGCENQRAATTAEPMVNEDGIAKSCTYSPVDTATANTTATIAVGNDGGWCALRVVEKDGMPFATGLVRVRPEHGRIQIEKSGNKTIVKYFPAPGYSGTDTFTTALRSRTPNAPDVVVKVGVTVTRG